MYRRSFTPTLVVAGALLLWSVAAWTVQQNLPRGEVLLPGPWDVIAAVPDLGVFAGRLGEAGLGDAVKAIVLHSLASTTRLLSGLLLGAFTGVSLGLLLGLSPRLRTMAEGPLLAIRTIPILALVPLFLTWFGGREIGSIVFIAFAVFSMLLVNTLEATRNVDPLIKRFGQTLGASPFRVYRTIVMPSIIPELAGGIRVVLGLSWAILLAAEYLAAQDGLGRILILAQQYSMTSRMVLILLLLMLYTFLFDRGFQKLVASITKWVPR